MSETAQRFLKSFNALSKTDQHAVLVNLLRLPIEAEYEPASDRELIGAAEAIFLELDKAESSQ
jgi:predicted regulator of Ras-like GTPase activity (Roadblock/LC7/MglB family)